jgi:hypothetical protein
LPPACDTDYLGAKLVVTQDKNQIKKPEETSNETQQKGTDVDENSRPTDETGGPRGLEPTRYGDWERKGRCIDF